MIVTERFSDTLIKTYSDRGMMIEQVGTGARYAEAIDPEVMGRTYTETDEPIEQDDEEAEAEEILNIILGGES